MNQEKINEIIKKIQTDKKLQANFLKNPVAAIEQLIGIDLPDDQINKIINTVKSKLTEEKGKEILNKVTNLFNK